MSHIGQFSVDIYSIYSKIQKLGPKAPPWVDFCDVLSRGQRYHVVRFTSWRTITVIPIHPTQMNLYITTFCSCHSNRLFVDQASEMERTSDIIIGL